MSRLSPIEGNLELQFFEQLISISLEFESAFGQMTWLACNQLLILPLHCEISVLTLRASPAVLSVTLHIKTG
jgi:hypothetical protein